MPADALDIDGVIQALQLGRPQTQVMNAQISLLDFGRFRLLVTQERIQVDIPLNASDDLIRRGLREVVRQVEPFRPTGVGFNGVVQVELAQGEQDPSRVFFDASDASERLGAPTGRGGWKLLYLEEGAQLTLSLDPVVGEDRVWLFQVNRHYAQTPAAADADAAIGWFQGLDEQLLGQARQLLESPTGVEEHA
jgi:hypothetical protein